MGEIPRFIDEATNSQGTLRICKYGTARGFSCKRTCDLALYRIQSTLPTVQYLYQGEETLEAESRYCKYEYWRNGQHGTNRLALKLYNEVAVSRTGVAEDPRDKISSALLMINSCWIVSRRKRPTRGFRALQLTLALSPTLR